MTTGGDDGANGPNWQQQQWQQQQWQQQQQQEQQHWQQQQQQAQQYWQQQEQQPLPQAQIGGVASPTTNPIALAFKRAFRLRISPEEVTPNERAKLVAAGINDPFLQGFLAWRRSLLFLVALLLAPVAVLKIAEYAEASKGMADTLSGLLAIQMIVNVAFAGAMWFILPMWTRWRAQRRLLVALWLIYFITPFLIFLYPWRSAMPPGTDPSAAVLFGAIISLGAVMSLAPKAISLMPGLVRASVAVKLLLPGSSAPGWLIALVAPIYAIFFYVILVLPYQMSGSGFFVGAMLGFTGAQLWIARMGFKLARPEGRQEAEAIIARVRVGFHTLNGIGAVMLIIALADFATKLDVSAITVLEVIGAFVANVLLLTALATDVLLSNLHRAWSLTADPLTHDAQREYVEAIQHFANPQTPGAQQQQQQQ